MGGASKLVKNITKSITKPFSSVKNAIDPLGIVSKVVKPSAATASTEAAAGTTTAPAASDVTVAGTTADTSTEDVSKRKGLLRSAKGKKSLTVSRASGGGLNV